MESTEKKSNQTKSKLHRILVIDDERDAVDLLGLILTNEGYSVDKSYTVNEAIQILESSTKLPDLILLDVRMPGKNGIEFCKDLKRNKRYKGIFNSLSLP